MCKVKLQETQKVSQRNFRPDVFRVVRQLPSQLDSLTAWQFDSLTVWQFDSLTGFFFDSRGSCLVIIFVEVVSGQFRKGNNG